MFTKKKKVYISILLSIVLTNTVNAVTLVVPEIGKHGSDYRTAPRDHEDFLWWVDAQQSNQTTSMGKAWCQMFWCGCCMSSLQKYELKQSLIEPEMITLLRAGMLLAKEIISLKKKNKEVNIYAYGNGSLVACIASKYLQKADRSFVIGMVGSAIVSAIFVQIGKAEKFKDSVEDKQWNFEQQFNGHQKTIQTLMAAEGDKFLPRITSLTLDRSVENIPETLRPSNIVVQNLVVSTSI